MKIKLVGKMQTKENFKPQHVHVLNVHVVNSNKS